jgi:ribose/xylose/arabinose/galactoside ABC-type transport system permease subunit
MRSSLNHPCAARSWGLLALYVVCVLGSLPFTRDVTLTLRDHNLLTSSVTGLYLVAVGAVVYHMTFDVQLSDVVAFVALVALAGLTAALILGHEIPEERVHYLQYGLMAWLARSAFGWSMPAGRAYLAALVFATGIGIADELVQYILPSRVYDFADIVLNAQATLLALVADEILHNRLGWRREESRASNTDR